MLMKSCLKHFAGITTNNYINVLRTGDVKYGCCLAILDEITHPRFQIVPQNVQASPNLAASKAES
ncbi:hypothetical protein KXD40_009484 [Peronospora effusa]|uniref:Uncharacterized protein n=1 Tax=Peronospora effusa TaxID=542832 RepID=A0A425CNW8_9STRA|nr:hypothetical protein DD237_007810 [Peronospora effusa]UIZ28565.1 hypothetical protein KXD40_009484 [Peronospora effusa]